MSVASAYPPGEPMSWEEYTRRGSEPPSEYRNGRLVMVPPPSRIHQRASFRLTTALLHLGLDGYDVTEAWGWKIGSEEFIPDVMVHPATDENTRFTGVPLLVVEITSSNRTYDTLVKTQKYARGGAPNYWVLDPAARRLTALRLGPDGDYELVAEAGDETGPAEIPLDGTTFRADISALLD